MVTSHEVHIFHNRPSLPFDVSLVCCSISTVYKALCTISKETVIIKAYEKAKMKTKNFLRMEREIKLMQCLVGEGLAQLYGVFEDATHKTLVMEYCKGGDLFKLLLLKGGCLDEHWVCVEVCPPLSVLVPTAVLKAKL